MFLQAFCHLKNKLARALLLLSCSHCKPNRRNAMSAHESLIKAALVSVVALGAGLTTLSAFADHEGMEQCAGVIKAGKNDCATSSNACHGHVTVDASKEAWIYVPKGTCEKLAGAHVVTVTDPSPKAG
jgi:uncharacterized membrane protein